MPITITIPPVQTSVGPGLPLGLQSDFIGPFPSDAQWHLSINLQPDFIDPVVEYQQPCTGPITSITLYVPSTWTEFRQAFLPVDQRVVFVEARIVTPTEVVDSGTINAPWSSTEGLGLQADLIARAQAEAQSGFTSDDRILLQDTERRTQTIGEPADLVIQHPSGPIQLTIAELLARPALDTISLLEITRGPTSAPVFFTGALNYYGVVIRMTTIDPTLTPKTPDHQWYFPDLAVLRVFKGSDLLFRRGVHTPTFRAEGLWDYGWLFSAVGNILGLAPDITIRVDWRLGCAGQVFLLRFP